MSTIQEIICPPKCFICEKVLFIGEAVCSECAKKLPYISDLCCMKCGKPIEDETKEYCADCIRKKHYFERNIALFSYSSNLKKAVYKFKYSNKRYYGRYFAKEMTDRYFDVLKSFELDAIIPVPLYRGKLRQRGYNQAELLANEIGRSIGVKVLSDCVVRIVNTIPMKQLNDKERQKNIKGSFKVVKNVVKLKKILLVDDIFTTGSTVDEISRVLTAAGVEYIYVITLCVGRGY